jgi:hypothetical protein
MPPEKFILHWQDGSTQEIEGNSLPDALRIANIPEGWHAKVTYVSKKKDVDDERRILWGQGH